MSFDYLVLDALPTLLAAGGEVAEAVDELPEQGDLRPFLQFAVTAGVYILSAGMALCLWRLMRGPSLADRVLAADLLALHVVGLVLLLTIYLGSMVFFDAAMVVSIIGFVSTIGFSQYIYAQADAKRETEPATPAAEGLA